MVVRPFRIGKALGSNPNISIFISSVFQNLFQKLKECSLDCKTKERSECIGCSSVVERPFRFGGPWVRIPMSPFLFHLFFKTFSKNLKNAAWIVRQRDEARVGDVAQW